MKRVLSLLIAVYFLFSGCSKFLDEDNKSGITNDEFYKTKVGFESLMTASYNSLRDVYGQDGENAPWLFFAGTDMYQRPRSNSDETLMRYTQLFPTEGRVLAFYKNVYGGIQRVNMGLHYIDGAKLDDALKTQYRAELTFLRAFYHFLLLEQFGGIVINAEATLSPRTNIPRSSLQESYAFIISEMEKSVENLPVSNLRFGKAAGYHYLAKVYVTKGWDLKDNAAFTKAKEYALKAIDGKAITIPFETLWSPKNENNAEFLFSVQYDPASLPSNTSGNAQQAFFGPYLGGTETGLKKYMAAIVYPSWSLHTFYGQNDARYNATFMLTIYNSYYDYYEADTSKSNITAYYPRVWGRDFTTADSLAWINAHKTRLKKGFVMYPFKSNEEAYRYAYERDMTTPGIKKFDSPASKEVWSTRASVRDIVLARRAETYFLYAEACIGLNQFTEAAQYVQKVLDRPGNAKDGTRLLPSNDIAAASSQSEAKDFYLIESAKEFAGEFLRWPELRRLGKLKEFNQRYNYDIKNVIESALPGDVAKRYRPIPQSAIDLNDALTAQDQNPGY